MIKLRKLLKDINVEVVKGSRDIEITGICSHSKFVAPGNIFVARQGSCHDGHQYVSEALTGGAIAILSDFYDPFLPSNITQIVHPEVRIIEGLLANRYYGSPSKELFVVGITGTNGKTTCTYMVKHIFDGLKRRCGLIGTIEYIIGNNRYPSSRTTPDVITNQKMLREMLSQGCEAAVMEVSSHGLKQRRVQEIEFNVAVLTNLSQDHLDYHDTMENYCEAKARLFESCSKAAIINVDDPWHKKILGNSKHEQLISYGINQKADLKAKNISLNSEGTSFTICYKGKEIPVSWKLIGRFNIYNFLATAAVGLTLDIDLKKICSLLSSFKGVPGRLESIPNNRGLNIYVDYAHTDDAIKNALECLQELKKKKIIIVFGCGGNRDQLKRPKMAEVAEKLSDFAIVTSDNPRNENISDICHDIVKGFTDPNKYFVETDRKKAIEKAIHQAEPDDIVLIAGKGHEPYQIFAHQTIEFDDRIVAATLCES